MRDLTVGILIGIFLIASAAGAVAQTSLLTLPKVLEPKVIAINYSNDHRGRVLAADDKGRVQQWLEVWENEAKVPTVVTYVLAGLDRSAFSVIWGQGPVNMRAFNCKVENVPKFADNAMWVATVEKGTLKFKEINDNDIKGLFANLFRSRNDWDREVGSQHQRHRTNITESNILSFLKEKNRERWLQEGWLQNANDCVKHF